MKLSLIESRFFGRICYGFKRDKKGIVEIVPEEAEVVKPFSTYTKTDTVWRRYRPICLITILPLLQEISSGVEMSLTNF